MPSDHPVDDAQHLAHHRSRTSAPFSASIADELQRYDAYLRDVQGLATGTRQGSLRVVGLLLHETFKGRTIEIGKLRPDDIRQFLAARSGAGSSASDTTHLAATLRSYLRHRATCGDPVGHLTSTILNPVHWKLAALPRALKPEEVDHLMESVVGARQWPKRNYAAPCPMGLLLSGFCTAPAI